MQNRIYQNYNKKIYPIFYTKIKMLGSRKSQNMISPIWVAITGCLLSFSLGVTVMVRIVSWRRMVPSHRGRRTRRQEHHPKILASITVHSGTWPSRWSTFRTWSVSCSVPNIVSWDSCSNSSWLPSKMLLKWLDQLNLCQSEATKTSIKFWQQLLMGTMMTLMLRWLSRRDKDLLICKRGRVRLRI